MELAPLTPVSLPRSIALDGTTNFRDLGGYVGADGRTVRWRKLFRSDHLAGLSPADLQALQALGVARAVDFRGVQERASQGYAWPFLEQQVLGIEPTVVQRALALGQQGLGLGQQLLAPLHLLPQLGELGRERRDRLLRVLALSPQAHQSLQLGAPGGQGADATGELARVG